MRVVFVWYVVRTDFTTGVAMKCENEALSGADVH
jgi:hypothetical protein